METALRKLLPVDKDGIVVNAVVRAVESEAGIQRVSQICERFGVNERFLQRLSAERIGLTPKWLIRRRRLQEAARHLAGDASGPAGLAPPQSRQPVSGYQPTADAGGSSNHAGCR